MGFIEQENRDMKWYLKRIADELGGWKRCYSLISNSGCDWIIDSIRRLKKEQNKHHTGLDDKTFKTFLDLLMCSDPWPISPKGDSENILQKLAHTESIKRGYEGWVDAFHKFGKPEKCVKCGSQNVTGKYQPHGDYQCPWAVCHDCGHKWKRPVKIKTKRDQLQLKNIVGQRRLEELEAERDEARRQRDEWEKAFNRLRHKLQHLMPDCNGDVVGGVKRLKARIKELEAEREDAINARCENFDAISTERDRLKEDGISKDEQIDALFERIRELKDALRVLLDILTGVRVTGPPEELYVYIEARKKAKSVLSDSQEETCSGCDKPVSKCNCRCGECGQTQCECEDNQPAESHTCIDMQVKPWPAAKCSGRGMWHGAVNKPTELPERPTNFGKCVCGCTTNAWYECGCGEWVCLDCSKKDCEHGQRGQQGQSIGFNKQGEPFGFDKWVYLGCSKKDCKHNQPKPAESSNHFLVSVRDTLGICKSLIKDGQRVPYTKERSMCLARIRNLIEVINYKLKTIKSTDSES